MAAKKKHAPSVLITDEENSLVREILGQQRYVSIIVKSKNVNLVLGARFHEKTSATCGQNCSSKYSCAVSKFALSVSLSRDKNNCDTNESEFSS